jgi:hypothetical protein
MPFSTRGKVRLTRQPKGSTMNKKASPASVRHAGQYTVRASGKLLRAKIPPTPEMKEWSPTAEATAQFVSRGSPKGEWPEAEWVVVEGNASVSIRDKDTDALVALRVVRPKHVSSFISRHFPGPKAEAWRACASRLLSIQKGLPRLKRSSSEEGSNGKTVYLGIQGNPGNCKKRNRPDGSPPVPNRYNPANDPVVATVALQTLARTKPADSAFYLDLVAAIDADTREYLGQKEAAVNAAAVGRLPASLRKHLGEGVELFTQTEIISSTAFGAHYDSSCVQYTFSSVLVLGDGDGFAGGGQVLLQRGVELTVPQGTLIVARYGEELHGVTSSNATARNNRVAVVAFVGRAVVERGERMVEEAVAKASGRELKRRRKSPGK